MDAIRHPVMLLDGISDRVTRLFLSRLLEIPNIAERFWDDVGRDLFKLEEK